MCGDYWPQQERCEVLCLFASRQKGSRLTDYLYQQSERAELFVRVVCDMVESPTTKYKYVAWVLVSKRVAHSSSGPEDSFPIHSTQWVTCITHLENFRVVFVAELSTVRGRLVDDEIRAVVAQERQMKRTFDNLV